MKTVASAGGCGPLQPTMCLACPRGAAGILPRRCQGSTDLPLPGIGHHFASGPQPRRVTPHPGVCTSQAAPRGVVALTHEIYYQIK